MSLKLKDFAYASIFAIWTIGMIGLGVYLSQSELPRPAPKEHEVKLIPESAVKRSNKVRQI